jgi:putative membrane protein
MNLQDGEILFVADTLNVGEVDEAEAALPKLTDSGIRDFAQEMIDEHGTARDQLQQLAQQQMMTMAPSAVATNLQSESRSIVSSLNAATPDAADKVYIGSQVKAHTEALTLIDQLLAAADSSALRTQLTTMRASVQEHLNRAQALNAATE